MASGPRRAEARRRRTATRTGVRAAALPPHLLAADAPILAVNVLALAILVGGLLYLGRYQDRLIESELEASRRKPASSPAPSARPPSPVAATRATTCPTIWRARWCGVWSTTTRTRLFDASGTLVADSRVLIGPGGVVQIEELARSRAAG